MSPASSTRLRWLGPTYGSFDRAITEFAESYADQNERDYEALMSAVDDGRIVVQRETD